MAGDIHLLQASRRAADPLGFSAAVPRDSFSRVAVRGIIPFPHPFSFSSQATAEVGMRGGTAKLPAHAAVRHGQPLPGAAGGRGLCSPLVPCPGAGRPRERAGRREAAAPAAGSAHAPAPGERSRRPPAGRSPARSEVHANRRIIPPERGGGGGEERGAGDRNSSAQGDAGRLPGGPRRGHGPGPAGTRRGGDGRRRGGRVVPCPPRVPWAARRCWRRPGRRRADGARGRRAARPAEGAAGGRAPTGTPGRHQHRPRPRPAAAAAQGPAAPPGGAGLRQPGRRQRGGRAAEREGRAGALAALPKSLPFVSRGVPAPCGAARRYGGGPVTLRSPPGAAAPTRFSPQISLPDPGAQTKCCPRVPSPAPTGLEDPLGTVPSALCNAARRRAGKTYGEGI